MDPALRARALAEWRGYSEKPRPAERTVSVGESLQRLLPKLGLKNRLAEEEISACWKEVVGDFLATHSKPVGLQSGVLLVQVLQPSVRYELDRVWKSTLLARLKERFSHVNIRSIRFRL